MSSLSIFIIVCVGMHLVETFGPEPCVWTKDSYGYTNVDYVDDHDWALVCGESSPGGPVRGIDGNDDCYLALWTISLLTHETALLISPCYKWDDSGNPNVRTGVQFYNFLYADGVASVNVYLRPGCIAPSMLSNREEWQQLTLSSRDTNDEGWRQLTGTMMIQDVEFQNSFQILLEAVIGNNSMPGYIAIDKMAASVAITCSSPGQLFCDNSNCIVNDSICDESVDCIDNADESSCDPNGALPSSSAIKMATSSSATTTPIHAHTTMIDLSTKSTTFTGSSPIPTTQMLTTAMADTPNLAENTPITNTSTSQSSELTEITTIHTTSMDMQTGLIIGSAVGGVLLLLVLLLLLAFFIRKKSCHQNTTSSTSTKPEIGVDGYAEYKKSNNGHESYTELQIDTLNSNVTHSNGTDLKIEPSFSTIPENANKNIKNDGEEEYAYAYPEITVDVRGKMLTHPVNSDTNYQNTVAYVNSLVMQKKP